MYECDTKHMNSEVEDRVLTARTDEGYKTPPVGISVDIEEWRKIKKWEEPAEDTELFRIRIRVHSLSYRINVEQSMIEVYSGEEWKRGSMKKVRPEEEIQHATSEMLRCKLEMRDLFRRLDTLCSEGKLQESLFDSVGQIDSENIFCAKCGSKDVSLNNDIILCGGCCDRAFHQLCLVPRLLKVPPGDVGWRCPECRCKAYCISLLNIAHRIGLSLDDKWDKVFPEAATLASGEDSLPISGKTFRRKRGIQKLLYISCAKCGSNYRSSKNDIILCAGGCDRGFHQRCLVPPLLEVESRNGGWLCPECDCKADCINPLNELQVTDLSIDDKWEASKLFEGTRRSLHLSATKEASETENSSLDKDNVPTTTGGKDPVSEAKLF